ncbi:plasmid replication DNA-binding protein KfrA [Pseudomonas duriflava]|uniref:Plasmid replication DNA-binding protein KfrA n=1 Tax=Pseudomonas duriflava TaxID=459528 RepID=A0A562Q7J7_9PSED|nr:DNA-binding protein [Pseudomonas duriflava]TWI52699.1 plasmid replication DNA-binding protein KfrA [Pseudomonas duriflava]
MSRSGISKADVQHAIEMLEKEGKSVTVPDIRVLIGGSFTTIQRFKKEIEADRQTMTGPAGRIRRDITELVAQLEDKLIQIARLEAEGAKAALKAGEQAMAEKLRLANERLSSLQEKNRDLEMRLAGAESMAREYSEKYNAANNELARQAVDLTYSQRESATRGQRIETLSSELKTARDALEAFQEAVQRQRAQEQEQHASAANDLRAYQARLVADLEQLRSENLRLAQRLETEQQKNTDLVRQIAKLEGYLQTGPT